MAVKRSKPTSNARRQYSVLDFRNLLTATKPEKSLIKFKPSSNGRSNGRITTSGRGGGSKRHFRIIDFKQNKMGIPATVKTIEYDPNRTSFIAQVWFADGEKAYILAPNSLKVGDKVVYNYQGKIKVGNRMQLKFIPTGQPIHNIELQPGKGGQLVRSAGATATISGFDKGYAQIKMPSGEVRLIPEIAFASIGVLSNAEKSNLDIGKAGRVRLMGRRPRVRGKAKNPVDHPHGGGEGNTSIGLKKPKTPWGKPALGVKTRSNKKTDKFIVKPRNKKKR